MAFATIVMENSHTGAIKNAPVGFSWTTFFFGFFPALFRADFKWAVILLICAIITFGMSNLIFMFLYNKLYISDLVKAGFKVKSVMGGNLDMVSAHLGMHLPEVEGA